ncbi:tetratricopeptide repeat protein [Nostoc sp. MS1]|uniref:tetratricopeptide repeat protein n=1 Tax=Nostoc sp. MS1 TaxID=2764711 RepID=UPI001CC4D035|nr:tetratricopeptide repeat protein [Nostoc sp. MS1]BCL39432.1 hypothetical protein NSMS1_58790 [Nostoc sp. MS1]
MQWDEFLRQEAATHELSPEQTAAFLARLKVENSGKSEAKLASEINIGAAAFKKRMTEVYDKFAQSCPELATSTRGKLETLKAYLTAKYNGVPQTRPITEIHHNLPLAVPREKFVGREAELENLHKLLQENQQVAIIAAIAGMGGVGKTELALRYAYSQRLTYQGGICWLSAPQDLGVQLVQFARTYLKLSIPDDLDLVGRVQYCLRNWHEGEVLLVIDNVTNYREEVRCYLESVPSRFKQLITTREKLQSPIVRLDLDVLTPLAAMKLLKSIVGRERLRREPLVARKLCKRLGYLPLGLELVGRYLLGDERLLLKDMLQDLKNERLKHEALEEVPQEMKTEWGVADAFKMSWRRLRENAQRLGCVLSLFALAPIPWELVERVTINDEAQDWKKARRELLQLHLLQHKGEGVYQLHPLLREFFKDKLEDLEQAEEFKRALCRIMVGVAQDIPKTPNREQIQKISVNIPHIAEVANHLIEYVSNDDLAWSFVGNALFYNGQGLYDQAAHWYEQCREISKKRLAEEHPNFASILNDLALIYKFQGRYSEVETLYLRSLQIRQYLFGQEHTQVAQSLNNLAELYRYQGRYSEAEALHISALEMRQGLLGTEHEDVATSLNNIALLYSSQKRYTDAESIFLKALKMRQRLQGQKHPDVATILNNLAIVYQSQNCYLKAEACHLEALNIRQNLLPHKHPDLASSFNNLADLYLSQHRYKEVEPLFQKALEICELRFGVHHHRTIMVRNHLVYVRDRLNSQ